MIKESAFRPAWWLPGAHAQTLWASTVRRIRPPPTRAERLELADGDFLDLNWLEDGDGPVVMVLHGLQGSIESRYAAGLLNALRTRGYRAVFLHFRGCSGEPNRLARSYHSGDTGDLQILADLVAKRYPGIPSALVGYSLGGNVTLKWLGEQGRGAAVQAAVAVSVPLLLDRAATRLDQGLSRLYRRHLLGRMARAYEQKFRTRPQEAPIPLEQLTEIRSFWAFDDRITAPLHGFKGVDDYYGRSSSRQYLRGITVPTLILHARDDPFMTPDVIPSEAELSPAVTLELSEHGGHVGFVTGVIPGRAGYWLERRILTYIDNCLRA
ncbi:MAG: hydrolase [Chromatiales bacterium]|nr:hydrolase [Chromatiales bacterium]